MSGAQIILSVPGVDYESLDRTAQNHTAADPRSSHPEHERIVVIEDTSELRISKPNILAVECQAGTFNSNMSFEDLLKSALRWRPDRIILGEVRGIEARTLPGSFNTGHAPHAQAALSDVEAEIGLRRDRLLSSSTPEPRQDASYRPRNTHE
jgi:Flp pilus assembly CpaF family ATPase